MKKSSKLLSLILSTAMVSSAVILPVGAASSYENVLMYYDMSSTKQTSGSYTGGEISDSQTNTGSTYECVGGLFGKSADDGAFVINRGTGAGSNQVKVTNAYTEIGTSADTMTYEVQMAANMLGRAGFSFTPLTNSTGAASSVQPAIDVEKFNGTITTNLKENGTDGTAKTVGTYTPGQWIKVAVEVTKSTDTVKYYINGELVDTRISGVDITTFYPDIRLNGAYRSDITSTDLDICFDNFRVYEGTYAGDDAISLAENSKVTVDGTTLKVAEDATLADVTEVLGEGAVYYTDSTLAKEATELADGVTAVVTNGEIFGYYTIATFDKWADAWVKAVANGSNMNFDGSYNGTSKYLAWADTNVNGTSSTSQKAGIGLKSATDYAYVVTASSVEEDKSIWAGLRPEWNAGNVGIAAEDTTIEAQVYISDNVQPWFGVKFTDDDAACINTRYAFSLGAKDDAVASEDEIIGGRWYKLALTVNAETDTAKFYINGKYVGETVIDGIGGINYDARVMTALGAEGSFAAVDNYRIYGWAYDPTNDVVENAEPITVQTGTLASDIDGIAGVVDADGTEVTGEVSTGDYAVYASANGEVYEYALITTEGEPIATEEPTEAPTEAPEQIVDATASDLGITSSHPRVAVREKAIAAISTPWHGSWIVSSDILINALTSSEGYTLSYVDKNKEDASSAYVTDGYVKAKKANVTAYIPIVLKVDEVEFDIHNDNNGGYYSGDNTEKEDMGGLGGKAVDDVAYSLRVCSQTFSEWGCQEIKLADKIGSVYHTDVPFTVVFNAYADGDAVMRISCGYRTSTASEMFLWEADGTLKWRNTAGDNDEPAGIVSNVTRGRWHRFAIVWDPRSGSIDNMTTGSGRYELYVDGQRLGSSTFKTSTDSSLGTMLVGVDMDSTSGRVAFDDFVAWTGEYDGDLMGDVLTISEMEGATVNVDTKTVIADPDVYSNVADLNTALTEALGTENVKIFSDSTFTAEATELVSGIVALVELETGAYHYLDIKVEAKDEYNTAYIREDFSNTTLKNIGNDKISMQLYSSESCYSLNGIADIGAKRDKALVISSVAGKTLSDNTYSSPQIDLANQSGYDDNIITAECSICSYQEDMNAVNAGEPGIMLMQDGDWSKILNVKLQRDGYIYINGKNTGRTYNTNQWYKVAFVLNKAEATGKVYINGDLVDTVEDFVFTKAATRFRASVEFDVTDYQSKAGAGAFDDFRIYAVEYDPTDDIIEIEFDDTINYIADYERITNETVTKKQIMDALTTNAAKAEVYSDDWYEDDYALEDDDELDEYSIVTLVSASGESFKYIRLGEEVLTAVSGLAVTEADGTVTAAVDIVTVGGNAMLVIAGKDSSGVLQSVKITNITASDLGASVKAELAYNEDYTYTAYVWTASMQNLADMVTYTK